MGRSGHKLAPASSHEALDECAHQVIAKGTLAYVLIGILPKVIRRNGGLLCYPAGASAAALSCAACMANTW